MNNMVLHLQDIHMSFKQAGRILHVLRGCNLNLMRGEKIALIAPSGAGKSTLLHIAGLLEKPQTGQIIINDKKADNINDKEQTKIRLSSIGFVYQFHHLLPEFSAKENIIIPQMIAGKSRDNAKKRADELLELIALSDRATHRPAELSGGEQQRIAIARALANSPSLLIADEPTGNLDPNTADNVFSILQDIVSNQHVGLLMATHNMELASSMDRICELKDGVITE